MKKLVLSFMLLCGILLCMAQTERVVMGDEQTSEYFPILKNKRIAIFSNQTGMMGDSTCSTFCLRTSSTWWASSRPNTASVARPTPASTWPVR